MHFVEVKTAFCLCQVDSHFLLATFFGCIVAPRDRSVEELVPDVIYQLVARML